MNYNPIIIPSKHIYGNITYNTSNNIINGISYKETNLIKQSGQYNDEKNITLITCETDPGKQMSIGDISWVGDSTYTEVWNDTNYNIFANDTTIETIEEKTFYKTTVNFDLYNYIVYDNFIYDVGFLLNIDIMGIKSLYSNDGQFIAYRAYDTEQKTYIYNINYEKYGIKIINPRIENNILYVDVYALKSNPNADVDNPDRLPLSYTIQLFGKNYKKDNNNVIKKFGNDISYEIENNELLSNTTGFKLESNYVYISSVIYQTKKTYKITTSKNVESDIIATIKISNNTETTLTIPKGQKNSQTIDFEDTNTELSIIKITPQFDNYYIYDINILQYNRPIGDYIANNIIENYKNGKKRISIQVGYGDYYYANGTPYGGENGKKKLLEVGDIVQPMQWKNNQDIPFAIKKDGSPMIFEITSAELDTNGAPKLFLELLEKTT